MVEEPGTVPPIHKDDGDLYLIEMPSEKGVDYLVCQRMIVITPAHGTMDVPWRELEALFAGKTLRAIPMPGRLSHNGRARFAEGGVSSEPGVSSGPDVTTSIEVNLFKIEPKS